MRDVVLGMANVESQVGNVEANLCTIDRWAGEAAAQGVEICVFPELGVHGYDCSDIGPLCPEEIVPIPSTVTDRLCAMALKHGMMLVPGLLERSNSGVIFNTQLVINSDGTIQGGYRKTHPGISELPTFSAGDELPVFHHPKINFGIQTCYDTHFPLPSMVLASKGCELIICPHASATQIMSAAAVSSGSPGHFAPGRARAADGSTIERGPLKYERWLRYIPARAYDNSIFTAICNQVGRGPSRHARHLSTAGGGASFEGGGVSFVCAPSGEVIAGGPAQGHSWDYNGESLLVCTLQAAALELARTPISFFRRWHHPRTQTWVEQVLGAGYQPSKL